MSTQQAESPAVVNQFADGATVTFERHFDHPIDDVWRAITEPSEIKAWLADSSVDLRVGGAIQVRFEGSTLSGVITDLDPPRIIAYSWHEGADRESHVRFDLAEDDLGTTLRLVHVRLDPESASGFAAGWHHHLELLAAHVSGTDRDWDPAQFEELKSLYG